MPESLHNLIQSLQKTHEVAFNILFYEEGMKHKRHNKHLPKFMWLVVESAF